MLEVPVIFFEGDIQRYRKRYARIYVRGKAGMLLNKYAGHKVVGFVFIITTERSPP